MDNVQQDERIKEPSRHVGGRLRPRAQQDLLYVLDHGAATDNTDALEKALAAFARSVRRRLLERAA